MLKAIRLTKAGREKIVRDMSNVFKKYGVYSNIDIIYNNKMVIVGDSHLTEESNYSKYSEPSIIIREGKKPSNWGGNDNTILVMYDGGPLYSCMSGEFGYSWRERLMEDLDLILGPYHLDIQEIDHISFSLIEDVVPEYKLIANKLSGE